MHKVNKDNLECCIEQALKECRIKLSMDEIPSSYAKDHEVACKALEKIQSEISTGKLPTKEKRAADFTWYVVDKGDELMMDYELSGFITKIEDIYRRRL